MADGDMSLIAQAGTVIVPGWRGADTPVPDALCQQLREAHRRGCRILSICSGVFVLAAAGLLEGCRATTHWRYLETLQQRYPDVEVVPDVLYVDEGTVLTSAGSAAGIDLCLHLVRRDFGQEATNSVARRLVVQPHRDGGQTQNIVRPVPVARESKRLGLLFDYLHQQLADNHTVASLASRAGMSPRTFLRRFQDATGTTPARWLLNERLMRARGMLEKTRLSLDSIAIQVGFGSSSTLRYHFQQHFSVSPAAYRKSFT
ncbi:transcriptional activator FtrA [Atlantibacter hermannii]|nr:transcriptional activator FtrA [Atlantibacter hermannii]